MDDNFGGLKLIPTDSKTKLLELLNWCTTNLSPFKLLGAPSGPGRAALFTTLTDAFIELEKKLSESAQKPFYLGQDLSFLEVMIFPFIERCVVVLGHFRDFKIPEQCPTVQQWYKNLCQHKAIQPTMQEPQVLIQAYAKFAPK